MIFKTTKHKTDLYNILLALSRNIFFYKKIKLSDTFETRIYLMFFHFAILMIVSKKKGIKFDQNNYDYLFNNIENNLRELGFGDVTVNKKMKELNKILYDILLKIEVISPNLEKFFIKPALVQKYFSELENPKNSNLSEFSKYFEDFFDFCFELPINNMVRDAINYKY